MVELTKDNCLPTFKEFLDNPEYVGMQLKKKDKDKFNKIYNELQSKHMNMEEYLIECAARDATEYEEKVLKPFIMRLVYSKEFLNETVKVCK